MRAAIYSRKSKFTGKGESVENQIQLRKEYGIKNLDINARDFVIYEDEGFSGSNTNRPQFQKMLRDVKKKNIDIIICYRLDRISRNVLDFLNLIEVLNKDNIGFVSIREQFDTTTPIGRAMMYIASVFSQLERETIAERIKDNMMQLAKSGRWLGGNTPTGFRSEAVINKGSDGKEKKEYKLAPIDNEIALVKKIYDKFLENKSLTGVEQFLMQNHIKTKNGLQFNRHSIKMILKNPVYARSDKELFEYFQSEGYCLCSELHEFNGINGIIGYNKTRQKGEGANPKYREVSKWIIAIGKHDGVISGKDWIKAQRLLEQNKSKAYRRVKSSQSLLSGVLKCKNCGSFMRPKTMKRWNSNAEQIFYYICEKKEKSKKAQCQSYNINGNRADIQVLDALKKLMDKLNINFMRGDQWNHMGAADKRSFIKAIIDKILWDGEKLDIILFSIHMFP
ncbi:MAG TPA: resolvase [Clostridiaceae bacterium]|nr:resolvase [Clostridiaceae bacterium]